MAIFGKPQPRAHLPAASPINPELWVLRNVAYDETEKRKLLEEVDKVETEIFKLIAIEMRAALNKMPNATQIEVNYSKELKALLLEQAEWLEKAAKEARKEAKLENKEFRIRKYYSRP
jgi:hypothetical protein